MEKKIERVGKWAGRTLPGSAKRLGRLTKKTAKLGKQATKDFGKAFAEGYKEA